MNNQKGYIKIVLVVFALIIGIMIFPLKFPTQEAEEASPAAEYYCRDIINDGNAPTVEAPSYTTTEVLRGTKRTYRLLKQNVAMDRSITLNETPEHHFFPDFKEQYTNPEGEKFVMRLPQGQQGRSYKLPSEVGTEDYLQFSDYGLLYLFHADDSFVPVVDEEFPKPGGDGKISILLADIYKAVDTPDLPEWVLTCYDQGVGGSTQSTLGGSGGVYMPTQERSPDKDEVQLEWFLFTKNKVLLQAWWVPHCKPAVYLYPRQKQLVNVQVKPLGELGYTDPLYDPLKGWTVWAEPGGKLRMSNIQFPISNDQYDYLYYETKLRDEEIKKPKEGWMVSGDLRFKNEELRSGEVKLKNMEELFDEVLPKLGLNPKEKADFENYWLKTLPDSPYYFVGLVEKSERDRLEELLVTPRPDTSIRFSLYFEPLENPVSVLEPVIDTREREGFTLVDWGGMIKLHKDTPFTCSQ